MFISILLSGCAALGSSASIEDRATLQQIKTFVLPGYLVKWEWPKDDTTLVTKGPYLFLYAQLDSLFKMVSLDSSTVNIPARNVQIAASIGKQSYSDGVILAEMRYFRPPFDVPSAELKLTLIESSTGKIIARSSHNTSSGNSYFGIVPPGIEEITHNAIVGSIDALRKSLTSKK